MNDGPGSDALGTLFAAQRRAYEAERDPPLAVRRDRLDRLGALIITREAELIAAIAGDFGVRSGRETRLAELFLVDAGVRHARRNLARWMRPRGVPTPLYLRPGRSRIVRQPLGVVGVISPWNYPLQLSLMPIVGALAAGNRVLLKPSELTPRTSALLEHAVAERFAADELSVVNGGPDVGEAFAGLPFDHLFFTGSTSVGRKIALAAAGNLTPVTLELGGKSPALVYADADLRVLAPRLVAGKLLNAGQTCIAPDYVLAPASRIEALVEALAEAVAALYPRLGANPDYTSIVNDRHYARLGALIDDAEQNGARVVRLNPGNEVLPERTRKLAPTLLLDVRDNMAAMREEIFGPILPIEAYASEDEAIAKINARPRPLALYAFGGDRRSRARLLRETVAGGMTLGDTLWHFCNEELPFGGVGASGSGAYHGEKSFVTFSHEKSIFVQPRFALGSLLYPPYGRRFDAVLRLLKILA
jgi:coniferyl-aldehyde dehydrogenase